MCCDYKSTQDSTPKTTPISECDPKKSVNKKRQSKRDRSSAVPRGFVSVTAQGLRGRWNTSGVGGMG